MIKRTRKQPRRLTPPLVLRTDDGARQIIEVDDNLTTSQHSRSPRLTLILDVQPGIRFRVGSRSINKRRVTLLYIEPA